MLINWYNCSPIVIDIFQTYCCGPIVLSTQMRKVKQLKYLSSEF